MNDLDERLKSIRALYDALPEMVCEQPGKCANSCGVIDMSEAEHRRIVDLGVTIPRFTEERAARWAANEPLHCPALNRDTLLCDVYDDRPLICRLWGISDSMLCPQGCRPTRILTDLETYELLLASYRRGGHHKISQHELAMTQMIDMLKDPIIGELMARFVRGDRTVERELKNAILKARA